ncbi:hypothetical protein RRG08_043776 [Elysia crispata]|uniref:Uncharacterized protein n=1 Tax=Elysia crispata TaxID=231223 RepID=A0AAE1BA60_9GAST|nr:hypothetical protein RRG08_043776 [Elysia crispata]
MPNSSNTDRSRSTLRYATGRPNNLSTGVSKVNIDPPSTFTHGNTTGKVWIEYRALESRYAQYTPIRHSP